MKIKLEEGMRFGRLTVLSEGPKLVLPGGQYNRTVECMCDCGAIKFIRLGHLISGRTLSCGCVNGVPNKEKKHPLYLKWRAMSFRCYGVKHENYCKKKHITICDEWLNSYVSFKLWAMKNGYKDGLHIDRIDNSKGYSPDNCRFVTNIENVNNRDNTFYINYHGERVPFMKIIHDKKLWMNVAAIRSRIKRGWSPNDAIDTPMRGGNYNRKNHTIKEALKKLEIKEDILNR